MTSKLTVFFFVSLLIFSYSGLANAQTSTASSTETGSIFDSVIENVTEIKQTVQDQIQGSPTERNVALARRTQERIINLAANISNRFDGIIARLQNITDRLNQRIEKQASLGYNVDSARSSLNSAESSLNQARNELSQIDQAVISAIGGTAPKAEWKEVRQKYINARDSIRIAHAELRNTIINLKSATTPNQTATSSENTNTN
jgi:DNA anti-recombination protein RmuC